MREIFLSFKLAQVYPVSSLHAGQRDSWPRSRRQSCCRYDCCLCSFLELNGTAMYGHTVGNNADILKKCSTLLKSYLSISRMTWITLPMIEQSRKRTGNKEDIGRKEKSIRFYS